LTVGAAFERDRKSGSFAPLFATLNSSKEPAMHISSPFVVVPVIVVVFFASILFATSSKEDGHSSH
jgi:hypothetical protein